MFTVPACHGVVQPVRAVKWVDWHCGATPAETLRAVVGRSGDGAEHATFRGRACRLRRRTLPSSLARISKGHNVPAGKCHGQVWCWYNRVTASESRETGREDRVSSHKLDNRPAVDNIDIITWMIRGEVVSTQNPPGLSITQLLPLSHIRS